MLLLLAVPKSVVTRDGQFSFALSHKILTEG